MTLDELINEVDEQMQEKDNQIRRYMETIDRLEKTVLLLKLENQLLRKEAGRDLGQGQFETITEAIDDVTPATVEIEEDR